MSADIIQFIPAPQTPKSRRIFRPSRSVRSCTISPATMSIQRLARISSRTSAKPEMEKRKIARALTEISSLARSYSRTAVDVLVGVMQSEDATAAARVTAANAILDRGWGKATQPSESGHGGTLQLIHRIELRADFQHLRRWRRSVEQAQSYTFKTVITVIVTGFVGAVWLGIKATLGK